MSTTRSYASFSFFKQRGPRGFDPTTRYYDPLKEARNEKLKRLRSEIDGEALREADRELFASRLQHAWVRRSGQRAHVLRMVLALGIVVLILFILARRFGLLEHWNG